MNNARRVQFAYITTGSGAILASTLALLSAKVADGFYKNPKECPGWNISSKSSYIPEEATAAQEYATQNKDATIEEQIATHDEAFLNGSMSEIIEHPGEQSPTIVAQNARASRIAIRQGKAARGSAPGSSMILSERIQYLNRNNAQDTIGNASSVSGVRGKAVRRSAAGSSMVLSERDEFLNELPPSTNGQDTIENASSVLGPLQFAAGSSMDLSECDNSKISEETRITAQEAFGNPPCLSWKGKYDLRSSATGTSRMRSGPCYYTLAPPNPDYKGGDRVIKNPLWEGPIEPMIELPRPTIQNVAIQTLYPQLFKLELSCNEWIKKIFEMPETRQLDLAKDHTFKLDDLTYSYEPQQLEAALGQIRGVVARKPCDYCKSNPSKGPFATCVVVPGHDESFFGACCNCVYQKCTRGKKEKCTLYDGTMGIGPRKAEAKAKHPLRAASVALRSYFPKLRSIKSLPAEGLKEAKKEANPQSAAASQRQVERMWQAYPRGF